MESEGRGSSPYFSSPSFRSRTGLFINSLSTDVLDGKEGLLPCANKVLSYIEETDSQVLGRISNNTRKVSTNESDIKLIPLYRYSYLVQCIRDRNM